MIPITPIFTNFQKNSENLQKILAGSTSRFKKFIYVGWCIVDDSNVTNFYNFTPIFGPIFWKCSENLNGLNKMIPKIYICWGIVGDTNFTHFHQFLPIFTDFHQFWWQLSICLTRRFQKYIYVGVKSQFQFCPFQLGKIGGGVRKVTNRTDPFSSVIFR